MTDKGGWTCRQLGALGGAARKAQSPDYQALGVKGGGTTLKRHGVEHFRRAGKKGGRAVLASRGNGYFQELARRAAALRRAKARQTQDE